MFCVSFVALLPQPTDGKFGDLFVLCARVGKSYFSPLVLIAFFIMSSSLLDVCPIDRSNAVYCVLFFRLSLLLQQAVALVSHPSRLSIWPAVSMPSRKSVRGTGRTCVNSKKVDVVAQVRRR